MDLKQIRKEFKEKIRGYQKDLDEWKEKEIKPESEEEKEFHRFLKEVLELKIPDSILPTYPEFHHWVALKVEAKEILG